MPLEGRTDLVAPQALERLRFALRIGERPGRLLVALQELQSFINGPGTIDDFAADGVDRTLSDQALTLLTALALRDLGLEAGPDWAERAAAFDARPHTPQEQAVLERYARIAALKTRLAVPSNSLTEDEVGLRASMDALYARQQALQAHTTPGDIQSQALDGLESLLTEYDALRRATPPASSLQPYLCFFAASAAFALGRGRALCGELRAAERAFSAAADLYQAGGEPDQADQAQEEAERNRFAADADVDGASLADLRRMADGVPEPLERARALMRLCDRAAEANDAFSALAHAEAAARALALAGFPGPGQASPAAQGPPPPLALTLGAWIEAAASRGAGAQMMRLLAWVGTTYLRLASLRGPGRPEADIPGTRTLADAVTEFLSLLFEEAQAVHRQVRSALEAYGLAMEETSDVPPSRTPEATEILALLGDATELGQADALVAQADALGLPILQAQARLTQAIVRWNHDDRAGCIEAALEGEARLLGGRPAQALIGRPDFAVLLELRRQRLSALAGGGEVQAVFDGAWETVQAIEQARYRISDPFQQGAFLSGRTAFYELAAFSAFKLERWDDLLTTMDLFKARSALRNRLAPAPTDDGELVSRLRAATDAFNAAPVQDRPALAARRKAIWDLLTVCRLGGARAAELPELSVAAVQAVLAPEEAAVTWSFVAADVLIVLALDARRVHAERIILDDAAQQRLSGFVDAMEAGRVNTRALGRTVSALGEALLPASVRTFIADAKRLILSPHRQLNLIPLHAARLDGGALIERASVRYVPNLGSLLLPWRGMGEGVAAIGLDRTDVPGWPRLAAAEAEARDVCTAWADARLPSVALLGEAATLSGVMALDLGARRCIHIATHGGSVFSGDARDDPFDSFLVMKDAKLDALAISQLRLQAQVVVLSACFSGQRALSLPGLESLPGDDLFGLQAAFFQAGAQSVVGALWPLDDASAARILPRLHSALAAGVAPDLALQEALKRECVASPPDDIYRWAPLFLSSLGRSVETA